MKSNMLILVKHMDAIADGIGDKSIDIRNWFYIIRSSNVELVGSTDTRCTPLVGSGRGLVSQPTPRRVGPDEESSTMAYDFGDFGGVTLQDCFDEGAKQHGDDWAAQLSGDDDVRPPAPRARL